jgi:DNA repair protein RecO (recombination protein O)
VAEHLTTDALILRRVPFGEADLIVTLMTRDAGKLTALARAARSSKRRFGAALELGAVSSAELRGRRGGDLWTLVAATTRRHHALGEVAALAHASYGAELVRELTAFEQPEPEVFDLLVALYGAIVGLGPRPLVLRRFELALLGAIGLLPALERCAACGGEPRAAALLDPARGVLCQACAAHARGLGVRPLGDAARVLLIAAASAAALDAAPLDEGGDAAGEARGATAAIIAHHVGKPLRSVEFIAKVSAAGRSV